MKQTTGYGEICPYQQFLHLKKKCWVISLSQGLGYLFFLNPNAGLSFLGHFIGLF